MYLSKKPKPKTSYVYFVEASNTGLVKIGRTNNIETRLSGLRGGSPVPLILRALIETKYASLEQSLHKQFADQREHGEWFRINDELNDLMDNHQNLDIEEYQKLLVSNSLDLYLYKTEGKYKILFGKYENEYLHDIINNDPSYLKWIIRHPTFPRILQETIREEMK